MNGTQKSVAWVDKQVHSYFLWLLVACYLAASLLPTAGLWLRAQALGRISVFGDTTALSVPMLLLGLLLFNAGLGVRGPQLFQAFRRPAVLFVGIAANILYPFCLITLVVIALRLWHNSDEAQTLLTGLAIVAAMPIAGSSTGWAQNANGNMALSLGMVLLSTLLSPFSTPAAIHLISFTVSGEYGEGMRQLTGHGTTGFLTLCVVIPSLLGMTVGWLSGEQHRQAIRPVVRIVNSVILLLLCYTNATACLPRVLADPDWDFLLLSIGVVTCLSILGFGAGAAVARLLGTNRPEQASLMFGLGMNNNGTGLVMAAAAFTRTPMVLLPILGYNLVQHLVAGFVSAVLARKAHAPGGRIEHA
jgi:bile acid:Na+ symporter, BASS family